MAKVDAFLKMMNEQGASDLHLRTGEPPALRVRGDLERVKHKDLGDDELKVMLYEITPEEKVKVFEETGDADFLYEIPGLARYKANCYKQASGISVVFREIPSKVLSAEQLGLPPVLRRLALLPGGLVVATGPTGCGKATTLAAIIDVANRERKGHIMIIEDPLEYRHEAKKCLVSHREVGLHTVSLAVGMRAAMREDPDIIMVGEMRDPETTALAIEAASTGHLVFGTLSTSGAHKTVDRMIEQFPPSEQAKIRSSLAGALRAVISQVLLKRVDKEGRCAAFEILIATPAVRNLISEAKTHALGECILNGAKFGMQLLDDAIVELLEKGWISAEEAYVKSIVKSRFSPFLETSPADSTGWWVDCGDDDLVPKPA